MHDDKGYFSHLTPYKGNRLRRLFYPIGAILLELCFELQICGREIARGSTAKGDALDIAGDGELIGAVGRGGAKTAGEDGEVVKLDIFAVEDKFLDTCH